MSTQDDEQRGIPPFPKILSSDQISDAVNRSPDNGVTLFLSKLGISDIGPSEAEEMAHAGQHGFQEVMSTIERLALGHNRLSTLPLKFELFTRLRYLNLKHNLFSIFPEALTMLPCLDILDISHNKIRSLPLRPGNLTRLRVFSLSRNKITRLPAYLSQFRQLDVLQIDRNPIEWPPRSTMESLGDAQKGKEWIMNMQAWLEADGVKDQEYDDSGYSEQPNWEPERSYDSWQFPVRQGTFESGPTPHARSFSIDSVPEYPSLSHVDEERPTNGLAMGMPDFAYTENGQYVHQSPEMSATSSGDTFYTSSPTVSRTISKNILESEPMHLRSSSHASSLRKLQTGPVLPKQSLPDLRFAHKDFVKIPPMPESHSRFDDEPSILPPTSLRQNSEPPFGSQSEHSRISDGRSHSFVTAERSSYFQRSSNIPSNNALPRPLACLIETARSILFSMGELHQTLDRCAHHGTFDRSSLKFKKVLDPANMTMLHLIRSLDRFDDVSQQSLPSPAICRGLVECCRDTITAFRKSLGLLISQIGLEPSNDARFTRWLVLELYGIHAEISLVWQTMSSELESLKPYLSGSSFSQFTSFSANGSHRTQPHDIKPMVRLRSSENNGTAAKVGKARRHAGSFSYKDVEIGKELPSYDIIPNTTSGLAIHTHVPTLRTPKRQITVPLLSNSGSSGSYFPAPASSSFPPTSDAYDHLRQHSHESIHDSPSLISPVTPLESPTATRMYVSKDVLQVVQNAVQVAPMVWDQIERALSDVSVGDPEIRDNLDNARSVTAKLSRDIADTSEEDLDFDEKLLRENADDFVKIVVQLSNILKTHSNPRSVTAALRTNMVKLANWTQELSRLLQFTSISYTPRSSSPASLPKYATYNSSPYPVEDNLLSSSLSRTRSAQPSLSIAKLPILTHYDIIPPTLPLSIKAPHKRVRPPREPSIDSAEPG